MILSAPAPVLWTVGGVFLVLLAASLVVGHLRRARPAADLGELAARIRSWWVMAVVFAAAILLSRTVSIVFFAFVSFLALKEYLSLIPTRRADRTVLFFAYLAIPVQFWWIGIGWYGMFVIWVPVYMLLFLPLPMLAIGETAGFLRAIGTLHWGLMTTVFSIGHAAYLLVLPTHPAAAAGGAGLLLYLVILTEANDVAQYLAGKSLGRTKIIPRVSPNKTVEGFAGGIVATVALAMALAPVLTPLGPEHAAIAGLIIALAGFAGDLTVSAVKRDLGIKDTGSMLPGHGGVLDRLDSLTYTAPLFFHFIYYTYY
jgi:phosphatidate cytidylyltransferase